MDVHRIEIPEEYGGGWVDIKARRSWAASVRREASALRIKDGVTAADVEVAQRMGHVNDVLEFDPLSRMVTSLREAIVATSEDVRPSDISISAWLTSDELDEGLGDFLMETVEEHYAARRRTLTERKP